MKLFSPLSVLHEKVLPFEFNNLVLPLRLDCLYDHLQVYGKGI